MDGFSLRPITEEDVAPLLEIEKRIQVAPWTEQNIQAELAKPYSSFYVFTDDETDRAIASYLVYWVMFEECQILNLGVDLPYRGLGFAQKMIRQVVQDAIHRKIRKVILDVRKSNAGAIQLYQKCGFVIASSAKGFYSNGEDAYQMALHIHESGRKIDF